MEITWKTISELEETPTDAIDYSTPKGREYLQKIFIHNGYIDEIFNRNRYFIIGDKGTGKTAYAVYLEGLKDGKRICTRKNMQDTTYGVFVQLKKRELLNISDYEDIWRVIILLLICEEIRKHENRGPFGFKMRMVNAAVDEFYKKAFKPEIQYAINIVKESGLAVELFSKLNGEATKQTSYPEHRIQIDLMYLERKFSEAIKETILEKSYILFIDGIDARPETVDFEEYMGCVKGLINAIWSINTTITTDARFKTDIKVMLLIRPDIFDKAGMHNMNNKIRTNSVMLEWRTSYSLYARSGLFKIADRLLAAQQNDYTQLKEGEAWDHYFPYKCLNYHTQKYSDSSFIPFLRFSFYRPRDIIAMIEAMRTNENANSKTFSNKTFFSAEVKREMSEYLLGEIRDNLSFYYENADFDLFRSFFESYLIKEIHNSRFDYNSYCCAFDEFSKNLSNTTPIPYIFSSKDLFLQLLYEQNIIAWIETRSAKEYQRWYFKERSYSNIRPKVRLNCTYRVHSGIARALAISEV